MWLILILVAIAAIAVWVAYQVDKEGGYPPYQDNVNNMNVKLGQDDTWPFPKDKP